MLKEEKIGFLYDSFLKYRKITIIIFIIVCIFNIIYTFNTKYTEESKLFRNYIKESFVYIDNSNYENQESINKFYNNARLGTILSKVNVEANTSFILNMMMGNFNEKILEIQPPSFKNKKYEVVANKIYLEAKSSNNNDYRQLILAEKLGLTNEFYKILKQTYFIEYSMFITYFILIIMLGINLGQYFLYYKESKNF